MTDSQQLLAEFTRKGSEPAFRELVSRYVDLVYSTALRLVEGDTHRAEDVTQTVFVDLARLAGTLPRDVSLGGWLHRDTCFMAANLMRGERRRQSRERQAVEMNVLQNQPEADFSRVAPLLDEAINELGEVDRKAVLLRFFEQHDFRAVGQALGSTEDAARMRVNRALEKLETLLKRRGITTSAAALAIVLSTNAIQAAPVGLAVTISTAAKLAADMTTATLTTATALNWINAKALTAIVAAAIAAGTGTHLAKQREANRLKAENQSLLTRKAELSQERDKYLAAAQADTDELERLRKNHNELLRLRGEVAVLRNELAAQKRAVRGQPAPPTETSTASVHPPGSYIAKDQMRFGDFSTPEAAYESFLWAGVNGTYDQFVECLGAELLAAELKGREWQKIFETDKWKKKQSALFKGMRVLAKKTVAEDKVILKVLTEYEDNPHLPPKDIKGEPMVRVGNVWKRSGSTCSEEIWEMERGKIQTFVP